MTAIKVLIFSAAFAIGNAHSQAVSQATDSTGRDSSVQSQTTVRPMQVGDRWVYRFHNKGDKREPFEQWQQVLRTNGSDAGMYVYSGDPNLERTEWLLRWDQKRAKASESFAIDLTRANGIENRISNFQPQDDNIQLPLIEGKTYKVKFDWGNGNGYDEITWTVGPLKKHIVAAGEFWAHELVGKGWWNCTRECTGSGRIERRIQWSPELGREIRSTFQNWNTRGSLWENRGWELTQWQPAAPLVKDIAALATAAQKTAVDAAKPAAPATPSPAQ